MASLVTSDILEQAMIEGLLNRIRIELRASILKRIEPDIEQAIEAALKTFEVAIKKTHSEMDMSTLVKVIIEMKK